MAGRHKIATSKATIQSDDVFVDVPLLTKNLAGIPN
jgi:hypothetical protein